MRFFYLSLELFGIFAVNRVLAWKSFGAKGARTRTVLRLAMDDDFAQDMYWVHTAKSRFEPEQYSDILSDMQNHRLSKLLVHTNYRELVAVDNLPDVAGIPVESHYHIASINPIVLPNVVQTAAELHLPLYFADFTPPHIVNLQNLINDLFLLWNNAFPILALLFVLSSFVRFNQSFGNSPLGGNRMVGGPKPSSTPFFSNPFLEGGDQDKGPSEKPAVSLKDWAGSPEVLEECKEVISYIENKERFREIGAEMPKGILLEGPPGTGKTLLAKAIAGETNSTFLSMSGSEFVELFVGMGAARVREVFEDARSQAPCILFIDEIDAVAKQRGLSLNMGNDEREQTLNQLLYEMDGFNDNTDVVVMAATNRKDVLDEAILRPGRFDRIIRVPLPDKDSREKILGVYLDQKRLSSPFDVSAIAELTGGFSGAQLKNLVNEAAILSARNNYTTLQEKYVFDAFEKLIVGLIRANATVAPETRWRVALHETGHALLTLKYDEYFEFQKVSIQPTYNGAGGYTLFSEKPEWSEDGLYTKDLLKKRLIISMGGKAAESIYYGSDHVSLGAIQDLQQANSLAKRMVEQFGMGGEHLEVFSGGGDPGGNPGLREYSDYTKYLVEKESLELVKQAFYKAKMILTEENDRFLAFAELLQMRTTLTRKEVDEVFPSPLED